MQYWFTAMTEPSQLALQVEASLSLPPSRVGCRMRPERELAEIFGISRRKVRQAIDHLVETQILVREHGSGVYVRKIPPATAAQRAEPIAFEKLFVIDKDGDTRQRLQISTEKRSLNLEVWWVTPFRNATAALFKRGLRDQAEQLGHNIAIRELKSGREVQAAASRMLTTMGKNPRDGYIIHVPFAQACDLIDTMIPAPIIYVSMGRQPLKHQPMIRLDGTEMLQRVIELLAHEGYQRIGCLAFEPTYRDPNVLSNGELYREAVRGLKLSHHGYESVPLEHDAITAALKRLLGGKAPCDALYLSDDFLLKAALPIIEKMGYRPGKNLGMIVLSNRGGTPLPAGYDWSRIEYDPYNSGRLTITSLIRNIESAGEELLSFSHHPAWRPGRTHLGAKPGTLS